MDNKIKMGEGLLKEIEKLGVNTCKPITLEKFNTFMKEYIQPTTLYFTDEKGMIQFDKAIKFDKVMKEELKSLGLTPYIPAPLENDNKI